MGFLSPMQLVWAAAVIVVVLLYVRWAKRQAVATTTLPIWEAAFMRRTWWSRYRRIVSILAACVPVLLIALALARPFLSPAVRQSRSIVLVIDNSASMNAQQHGRTRLEDAKRQARRLIRNLRTHDRMAILSADSTVRTRCGLTGDRTALHLALDEVQPTDGYGAMSDAIRTARRLVHDEPRPVVVVVSDAAFEEGEAESGEDLVWIPVGGQADNMAITRMAARPYPEDPTRQEILVEVSNFTSEDGGANVRLTMDSQETFLEGFNTHVAAGQARQTYVTLHELTEPTLVTATLTPAAGVVDALSADNTASLLLVPPQPIEVLLISEQERSPVETALSALRGVEFRRADTLPQDLSSDTVVILEDLSLSELPSAPILVLGPIESTDLWELHDAIANPQATASPLAASHPLVKNVDLRDVIIDEAAHLRFMADARTLVESTSGDPLLSVVARATGDVVVLSFSWNGSDLELHADFPQLIANAARWLSRSDSAMRDEWGTNETIAMPATHSTNDATRVVSPYGAISLGGANLVDVGIWQLQPDAGQTTAILPVNLANPDESRLSPRESQLSSAWPYVSWLPDLGPLWSPLVALALVWIAGHWGFYQRRTID